MDSNSVTRREALRQLGTAGAGLFLAAPVRWIVPGRAPVEVIAGAVSEATLRLIVTAEGAGSAAVPEDGALAQPKWGEEVRIAAGGVSDVAMGRFTVTLRASPLRIQVRHRGRQVQELALAEEDGSLSFDLGKSPILGMGQGGPQFDRRGIVDRGRSGQGAFQLATHGSRVPVQWLVSTGGWALYIHQPLGTLDLSGARGRFTPPEAARLPLDVFVVAGTSPAGIMAEWAKLTGRPELPPLWTFGYHQSHRTLEGAAEVLWVAQTLREKKLPCDSLIYLGTGFTPSGWNTNNGEFRWNPQVFPDPDRQLKELHDLHFRVTLHAVLEGRRLNGSVSDPCPTPPAPGATGSGNSWPQSQDVACYWPIHEPIVKQAIDGWWPDQGDGLDGKSRLARIRMYWEGMQLYRPNERPFALHRNGYAGMARFAAFLWSGDVSSLWETLRNHVPIAINTGLTGIPYWGTDIGGFVPTPEYTGELHVRWFQFGAFCPLFRAHGRLWHLKLPWGWNTGELRPRSEAAARRPETNPSPSELNNPDVEPICRQYLELRYRLMPYLYTAVRETHDTGLPIMRALWLHYPDDPRAVSCADQYLWGRDMLVAPVLEKGATEREVYLPKGDAWYDFWTHERFAGGTLVRRRVDLATLPLYVRAGTVLPMGPVRQYTDEPVDAPTELIVYPGASGVRFLYEDDGRSLGYRAREWASISLEWNDGRRRLTVRPAQGSPVYGPAQRAFTVRLAPSGASRQLIYQSSPTHVDL